MKGCEAYLALCGVENSTVAACKAPGPIPDVLWTYDTKQNGGRAAGLNAVLQEN